MAASLQPYDEEEAPHPALTHTPPCRSGGVNLEDKLENEIIADNLVKLLASPERVSRFMDEFTSRLPAKNDKRYILVDSPPCFETPPREPVKMKHIPKAGPAPTFDEVPRQSNESTSPLQRASRPLKGEEGENILLKTLMAMMQTQQQQTAVLTALLSRSEDERRKQTRLVEATPLSSWNQGSSTLPLHGQGPQRLRLVPETPSYDGKSKDVATLMRFLQEIEDIAHAGGHFLRDVLYVFRNALKGAAQTWFGQHWPHWHHWSHVRRDFLKRFAGVHSDYNLLRVVQNGPPAGCHYEDWLDDAIALFGRMQLPLSETDKLQALRPTVPLSMSGSIAAARVRTVGEFRDIIHELRSDEEMRASWKRSQTATSSTPESTATTASTEKTTWCESIVKNGIGQPVLARPENSSPQEERRKEDTRQISPRHRQAQRSWPRAPPCHQPVTAWSEIPTSQQ